MGDDTLIELVIGWKLFLEFTCAFGPDDPLFPQTTTSFGVEGAPSTPRLGRIGWANADSIRKVFKEACSRAGLPHFTPHSLRHTLAELGSYVCTTPAEYKAWSQNLGHQGTLVTLTSYGTLPSHTQRELIRTVGQRLGDGPLPTEGKAQSGVAVPIARLSAPKRMTAAMKVLFG